MKKFILILFLFGCSQNKNSIKIVEKEEFQYLLNQDIQLIDVRTPNEFFNGTIGKARNINFNSPLFKEQVLKLNKNKPVVVFCHAGGRSAKASLILDSLGFKKVYDLRGGYSSWK